MKNIFYASALIIALSGCSHSKTNYEFVNDFEGVWGWSDNAQIRKGYAHSGNFCIEVNANDQYSMTFKNKLGDLNGGKKISTVNLKTWIKFSSASCKAKLVVAIDSAQGAPATYWMGVNAEDFISKPNQWTEVSNSVHLPKNINPENKLLIYVWCNGSDPVLVDDVSFEFK